MWLWECLGGYLGSSASSSTDFASRRRTYIGPDGHYAASPAELSLARSPSFYQLFDRAQRFREDEQIATGWQFAK
jgi:hypothetical protein